MSNPILTADQALLRMFARLMSNNDTVDVATSMMALCDDIPVPARTADMARIVGHLRAAHPEHAQLILDIAMEA